jgi:hypothetical protein
MKRGLKWVNRVKDADLNSEELRDKQNAIIRMDLRKKLTSKYRAYCEKNISEGTHHAAPLPPWF